MTAKAVVGVFETPQQAQRAVRDLKAAGFTADELGVISRHDEGNVAGNSASGTQAAEAATAGAAAGAGIGALWGLGILAGILPGVGPAIAGGTLGAILSSAAVGAAATGIAGALAGLGITQEEATFFEDEFKRGRTLVTVSGGASSAAAHAAIERNGGAIRQAASV